MLRHISFRRLENKFGNRGGWVQIIKQSGLVIDVYRNGFTLYYLVEVLRTRLLDGGVCINYATSS